MLLEDMLHARDSALFKHKDSHLKQLSLTMQWIEELIW